MSGASVDVTLAPSAFQLAQQSRHAVRYLDSRATPTLSKAVGDVMESCTIAVTSHDYADARRVLSECWIFTPERGLRAMTLHGNGSALAIDGRRLIRWCILEDGGERSIVAYLYSAEHPSIQLRDEIAALARERFGSANS